MQVKFVYRGQMIGGGNMDIIPRVGDFFEYQLLSKMFKVEAVMFKVVLSGDTGAIIYLVDVLATTEAKLRTY